ncbi:MAG: GNAT family N-acetyltransferase [Rikenellaceae bacterium]|nr:GNAT family N-acetyltransferase [Rikenellaceae bacterium]
MTIDDFVVRVATPEDVKFAGIICDEMAESAKARGTGIAKRSPEYVASKMKEEKAVVAFHKDGEWAGFSYIESWGHGKYVANSGLIINPKFRKCGLAKAIKTRTFFLSLKKFKGAKLFGLTTGLAVMKINTELGYRPVTFSELTDDDCFWHGCESCINYPILESKERKNCLCTAMLFDPEVDRVKAPMKASQLFEMMSEVLEH